MNGPGSATSRAAWGWGAAFMVGMFGTPALGYLLGLDSGLVTALDMLPMLLLIPMVRAADRHARAEGCGSSALRAYNRRMMLASFLYMAALTAAVVSTRRWHPAGAPAWALALLPAVPVLAMLAAMARYLLEEQDEYLRARVTQAALMATGLLLALATFWGFLETFELVPHVPGWAAVPIWSVGLGLGHLVNRIRA